MHALRNLLFSLALSLSTPIYAKTNSDQSLNPDPAGHKYAIVMVGSSRGERGSSLADPIDRNSFLLGGVRIYKHLRELGFNRENIYFLYADGHPDFSEPLEHETIEELRNYQFNGSYNNRATQSNLESIINRLQGQVTSNDTFVMFVGTHGDENYLEIEQDGEDEFTYIELQGLVNRIRPKQGLLVIDACHSGALAAKLEIPNYVIVSSTQSNTYGWVDRDYTTGANFFENLTDPESDANIDGRITMREAFDQTVIEGQQHWLRIKRYLLTRYNWGPFPPSMLVETSVIPMIYVESGASDEMYISKTFTFRP